MLQILRHISDYGLLGELLLLGDFLVRMSLAIWVLAQKRRSPESRIGWILLLLGLPFIGTVIFLLVGETRLGRRRIDRHRRIREALDRPDIHADGDTEARAHDELDRSSSHLARLAEQISGGAPVRGNTIELFGDTAEVIRRMEIDIDGAKRHCHLLFYIWLDDKAGTCIGEALIRAVGRGVTCRVLVDAVGSKLFLRSHLCERMREAGVQVKVALPANPIRAIFARLDLRNHRKIAVIDHELAWTGSQNLAEADFALKPRFAPWVDCVVRLVGPVAKELHLLFVEGWFLDAGESLVDELLEPVPTRENGVIAQVVASGPNFRNHAATQLIQSCIHEADEELVLTTPYFVPDGATIVNLATAARRGIKVTVVVPRRNDSRLVALASRSNYAPLLEAGVRMLEFEGGLLHAKTITVDRRVALVTSCNLDRRSFDLNFEAGVLIFDCDFASNLRFLQQSYCDRSVVVDPRKWGARPSRTRLLENAAGLLSPLL
ncbi:MAG: cardiolipin synthase [Phycisphaerae bacterium]|nr:cardiolipin synthase [Phycisphaerae bacterium]